MKKLADLAGPTPYPGSTPEAQDSQALDQKSMQMDDVRPDYTVAPDRPPEEFNWSMSGTHVMVSDDQHGEQFLTMDYNDFSRPFAYGKLELEYNWTANWHLVYTNLSHHIVEKRLKKYTRDQGWEWGGLLDAEGMPHTLRSLRQASVPGIGEINPGVKDWKNKEWSGMEQYDNPGHEMQEGFPSFTDPEDSESLNGLYTCSECGAPCMGHDDLRKHVMREHINPTRKPSRDPQPVVDLDDVLPAGFDKSIMDQTVKRQSHLLYHLSAPQKKAMGLRGDLPEGIQFEIGRMQEDDIHAMPADDYTDPTQAVGGYIVKAKLGLTTVGQLIVSKDGQVYDVDVNQKYRRLGVATAMLDALRNQGVEVHHSDALTPDGAAWAEHVGASTVRINVEWDQGDEGDEWHPESVPPTLVDVPYEVYSDDAASGYEGLVSDWLSNTYGWLVNGWSLANDPRLGASTETPNIPGPIPFVYDIETDRIFVGHPGERHSDIQGRFTPGGIVEGLYDPKGNVQIRTDTDMPYTVRHMAELWYALHPELQIKGIFLIQGDKKYRLASANIGHQVRNIAATDPAAWAAFEALSKHGNVYAVGGVVRDVVLGKTPKDVDLMVQGIPAEEVESVLRQLPGRVDLTGESFGVFRYRDPEGNEVEIALPRTERSTGPGHRDFEVYTDPYISVGADLARRDFTGNAMAVNLSTGDLVDPYHGAEDLKAGVLRTVSDRSFPEDPLRILRAFSQVSRHGLEPDQTTHYDLAAHAPSLKELPQERLQMELDKIMSGDHPERAISLMEQTGVLEHVLPDVAATIGFDQKNVHHNYPLNEHLRLVLENTAALTNDVDVRWAALLHDIGKPASQWIDPDTGTAHYYKNEQGEGEDHEEVGAEMARKLLTDLKFPTDRIDRICHLILHHMFPSFNTTKGARKHINRVGDEYVDDLMKLRQADIGGKGMLDLGYVPVMQQYVQAVREAGEPTNLKNLAINGKDLIDLGMAPGPGMGRTLNWLMEQVLEDPSLNNRETLLQMAQQSMDEDEGVKFSKTGHIANILDPIHDELDSDVFNHADSIDPIVKPKIAEWVKKKIYTTMLDAGWPDPSKYLSLVLTGSLTTYQWSAESDFDISLWVDVDNFPEFARAELVRLMIDKVDGIIVPGTTHPMQNFVVDVDTFSKDDLYQPGLRSAYDLDKQMWIILPERERSIDVAKKWPEHIRYAKEVVDKMKLMLRYGNDEAVKVYWHFLHDQRRRDMQAGKGDYALSNIVYKMIFNEGLAPEISNATGLYIA